MTIAKLSLIGKGFLHFSDENRYTATGIALRSLYEGDTITFINTIFSTKGRPGAAIINIIPSLFQILLAKTSNLYYYEPVSFTPLFLFNYFILCSILYIQYKFSYLIIENKLYSLISVLIFGGLTSSYIYLRHAVPYDASLLVIYFVLYKIYLFDNQNSLTFTKSMFLGLLSFFGFLIYPGNIFLYFLCPFILFFLNISKLNISNKLFNLAAFSFGSFLMLFCIEFFSMLGKGSFINSSLKLSSTITQGDFKESYSFLLKYLYSIEGGCGILIIISLPILIVYFFKSSKKSTNNAKIYLLLIYFTITYFSLATLGYFYEKFVFYGRTIHQFLPFLCLFFVYLLYKINTPKIITSLIIIFYCSFFIIQLINYNRFDYPRDIMWEVCKTYNYENISENSEFSNHNHFPYKPLKKNIYEPSVELLDEYITVVNSNYFMPEDLTSFNTYIKEKDELLLKKFSHPFNFKAYQFEGASIKNREYLKNNRIYIKVFKKNRITLD